MLYYYGRQYGPSGRKRCAKNQLNPGATFAGVVAPAGLLHLHFPFRVMTQFSIWPRLTTAGSCGKPNEWYRVSRGRLLQLAMAAVAVVIISVQTGCTDESTASSRPGGGKEIVRYLAGMEVLKSSELSSAERAQRHRQLRELTGVNPQQAASYLKQMRSDPRKWKKLQERMLDALHGPQQSSKE